MGIKPRTLFQKPTLDYEVFREGCFAFPQVLGGYRNIHPFYRKYNMVKQISGGSSWNYRRGKLVLLDGHSRLTLRSIEDIFSVKSRGLGKLENSDFVDIAEFATHGILEV